jgi:hypothetical protein
MLWHLVFFMVIWYIFPVLVCFTKKNLATLPKTVILTLSQTYLCPDPGIHRMYNSMEPIIHSYDRELQRQRCKNVQRREWSSLF